MRGDPYASSMYTEDLAVDFVLLREKPRAKKSEETSPRQAALKAYSTVGLMVRRYSGPCRQRRERGDAGAW